MRNRNLMLAHNNFNDAAREILNSAFPTKARCAVGMFRPSELTWAASRCSLVVPIERDAEVRSHMYAKHLPNLRVVCGSFPRWRNFYTPRAVAKAVAHRVTEIDCLWLDACASPDISVDFIKYGIRTLKKSLASRVRIALSCLSGGGIRCERLDAQGTHNIIACWKKALYLYCHYKVVKHYLNFSLPTAYMHRCIITAVVWDIEYGGMR